MKIAILGTKGIPNNYGGFEQFAEYLSIGLVKKGYEVTVYNPHFHPYNKSDYNSVTIKKIYSPEKIIGSPANFIYDFLCLKDALRNNFDFILECGYGSSAPSFVLKRHNSVKLITNMDGLEWKRSKWSGTTQKLMLALEKFAVKKSDYLISDNIGIRNYYLEKYKAESFTIPYGANLFDAPDFNYCKHIYSEPFRNFLIIARLEPENNVDVVLEGFSNSKVNYGFVVIGNNNTKYGNFLKSKFGGDKRIKFIGPLYDIKILNNLRYYSLGYFHGHSVGGTNPSLLEAMASSAFIISHDNEFNRSVLSNDAVYFKDSLSVKSVVENIDEQIKNKDKFTENNLVKIREIYNWERIVGMYDSLFRDLFNKDKTIADKNAQPHITQIKI